jgi:hypothetical protein
MAAQFPNLATKADVEAVKTEVAGIEAQLPHLATKAAVDGIAAQLPHLATKAVVDGIAAQLPHLATKADVLAIKADISDWKTSIIQWMVGTSIAMAALVFTIAKFVH